MRASNELQQHVFWWRNKKNRNPDNHVLSGVLNDTIIVYMKARPLIINYGSLLLAWNGIFLFKMHIHVHCRKKVFVL